MNLKQLKQSLADLASVIKAAGAARAAEQLDRLPELLPGDETGPSTGAVAELRDLLANEKRILVEGFSKRLLTAGTDEAVFESVFGELSVSKAVGKDEMDAIAHVYTSGRAKWSSRKAALDAIRKKFVERAYQAGKMTIVEKYKVG